MRRVWVMAAALAAAWSRADVGQAREAPVAPPPVEAFLSRPVLDLPTLSPSGRRIAFLTRAAGTERLVVQDLETGDSRALMEATFDRNFGGAGIRWVEWKGDGRLVVAGSLREVMRRNDDPEGRVTGWRGAQAVIALDVDGGNRMNLVELLRSGVRPARIMDLLPNDPDHVLMQVEGLNGLTDIVRVDVRTGERETVLAREPGASAYFVDREGRVVARRRAWRIERRDEAAGRWEWVADVHASDLREQVDFTFAGATEKPNELYVIRRPETAAEGDTAAVHVFDFTTGELGPPLWRHDRYDVSAIVRDTATEALLGGCYVADVYRCDFEDPRLQAVMTGLSRFFEDERSIGVVSQSEDGGRWVLEVSGPDEPGSFYLYDFEARNVELLGNRFPLLRPESLGAMRRIDYAARDGTALSGYLTALPEPTGAPRPLIVMPHGGPEARDHFGYDRWAQFLASRGYQVFQPNFRGSSGFGRAFAESGYRQWGGLMQDDVTDGVRHLIDQGLADPERICIVGASYGGYAALLGAAREPDLYRCAVSIAGVGDLVEMMRWERSAYGDDSDRYEYWVRSIGDPVRDRAALEAVSPIRFAQDWRTPVLLVHGEWDQVVPVEQSADFARALERAGKPVSLVRVERAGHSDWGQPGESRLLTELETFLARHLPVRPAAAIPSEGASQ